MAGWNTRDELNWLDRALRAKTVGDRKLLLNGYLKGCLLRSRWGNIDPEAAMAYARDWLERLT